MIVRFTSAARDAQKKAFAYIKDRNPGAALKLATRVRANIEHLKLFPRMGRLVPEFHDPYLLELIISPYRFFYKIEDETIWIVGVWHDRQLPDEPL